MFNLSAAMANTFVVAAEEMTETVRALGANPLKKIPSPIEEDKL